LEHAGTLRHLRVRPLPRDSLPMPPQNRVGGDDRGDIAQCSGVPVSAHARPTDVVRQRSTAVAHPPVLGGFDSLRSGRPCPPAAGGAASRPEQRGTTEHRRSTTAEVYITDRRSNLRSFGRGWDTLRGLRRRARGVFRIQMISLSFINCHPALSAAPLSPEAPLIPKMFPTMK
jgi:hypothetical protein